LIFNCEYGPEDTIIIDQNTNKSLSISDSSNYNTDSSTKLDNKLEISINKDMVTSSRNLNIISPANKEVTVKSKSSLDMLHGDQLKFTKVVRPKLPFLSLAVDITMSAILIKKLFIKEMKK
jgi:hypothetical protein